MKLFYQLKHLGKVRQFENPTITAPIRFQCRTFFGLKKCPVIFPPHRATGLNALRCGIPEGAEPDTYTI